MLKDFFSNRLFIGALAFFILTVGGSLLYMQHVERQSARELAAHEAHLKQFTEKQKPKPTAEVAKLSETPQQGGHFHADGTWHEGPHEPPVESTTAQFSEPVERVSSVSTAAGLPPSIGEQVAASDDVPKYAELKAMSDEELKALHDESLNKWEQLKPELWKRMHALGEAEIGSDAAKLRLAALNTVAWDYNVHQITASRAFDVFNRRLIRRNFNRPHGPAEMIIYPLPELTD